MVGVLLSLVALVLTFDAVAGERADGTLRLALSNSVRRSAVVAGKMIGAYVPLMAAWGLAMALQLLTWHLFGVIPLKAGDWARVLLTLIPVALFLAFFVALGVLISLLFQSRGACGTMAALTWAFFVLVVPNAGRLIASQVKPPRVAEGAQAGDAYARISAAFRARRGFALQSRYWGRDDPLGVHLEIADAAVDAWRRVRSAWGEQAHLARRFSRLSPASTLRYALEELTGQGLPGYEAFARRAEMFKMEVRAYLLSIYPLSLDEPTKGDALLKLRDAPMDPAAFPRFRLPSATLSESLAGMAFDLALLSLFAGLAFLAAVAAFTRCDVR
jgi:hypothetical protein